jgi:hypothetical protein
MATGPARNVPRLPRRTPMQDRAVATAKKKGGGGGYDSRSRSCMQQVELQVLNRVSSTRITPLRETVLGGKKCRGCVLQESPSCSKTKTLDMRAAMV